MAARSKYKECLNCDNSDIYPSEGRVFVRRHWRSFTSNMSEGGERWTRKWWFLVLGLTPCMRLHHSRKMLLQMLCGFGLIVLSRSSCKYGMTYLTHTPTTNCEFPNSLYRVGRDAHGNKARACIVAVLPPPARMVSQEIRGRHGNTLYARHMALTECCHKG